MGNKDKGNQKGTRQGNGSGHFLSLPDGRWRLKVQLGVKADGKRRV